MIGHTPHPWAEASKCLAQQGDFLLGYTLHGDSLSGTLPQDSPVHLCICVVFLPQHLLSLSEEHQLCDCY